MENTIPVEAGIPIYTMVGNYKALNPEFIWYLWVKEKSIRAAGKKLEEIGIFSPITGRPYSWQALHLAAIKTPQYKKAIKNAKHPCGRTSFTQELSEK